MLLLDKCHGFFLSFFKIYLFIFWLLWVFVAACSKRELLFVGGARASHCGGFSCCGAQALGTQASVVVAHGLSSGSSQALEHRFSSCGAWA